MNYSIIRQNGAIKLAKWEYYWPSDSFGFELGTSRVWQKSYGDTPFEEKLADLWPEKTIYGKGLFGRNTYPENNKLIVNSEEDLSGIKIDEIKGFKKFFEHMNITGFKNYEQQPTPVEDYVYSVECVSTCESPDSCRANGFCRKLRDFLDNQK